MAAFQALRVHQVEKTTTSRIESLTLADLNAGEVVIKVAYSGINYKDALAVTGKGRIMKKFPLVAGIDLAGAVQQSGDARFKPGDAVLVTGCGIGEDFDGGYAELARVKADSVVPLPNGLTLQQAMALGTAGFTAGLAVRRMLENHQHPDMGPIAITGPTGGVGSIAIQIFSQLGYEVVALTRKADAADYLKSLGAKEVVLTSGLDLGSKPMERARWGGAVDNVGGDLLTYLTRTVKPWGNISSIGLAASHQLQTTVMPFILRGVSLLGIHSVECPMPWRRAIWDKLAGDWKPKALDRIVSQTVALAGVPEACQQVIAGGMTGRTLVRL